MLCDWRRVGSKDGAGLNSVPDYLARLKHDNPLKSLVLGAGETREESVEKAFAISYEALTDAQKYAFRATSVFAPIASFARNALMTVWGVTIDDDPARFAAEDAITALTPSLLTLEAETGRYTQHGLLRAYAEALAKEAAEWSNFAQRHLAYYEALADYWTGEKKDVNPLISRPAPISTRVCVCPRPRAVATGWFCNLGCAVLKSQKSLY